MNYFPPSNHSPQSRNVIVTLSLIYRDYYGWCLTGYFSTIFTARTHYAMCTVINHCCAISVLTRSKCHINIIFPRSSTLRNLLPRGWFSVRYNLNHFKYMANPLFPVQTLASRAQLAMYTWQILLMFFVFLCAVASPIRIASSLGPLTLWNRLLRGPISDPYNLNFFKSRVYPRFPNIPVQILTSTTNHAVYTRANLSYVRRIPLVSS